MGSVLCPFSKEIVQLFELHRDFDGIVDKSNVHHGKIVVIYKKIIRPNFYENHPELESCVTPISFIFLTDLKVGFHVKYIHKNF